MNRIMARDIVTQKQAAIPVDGTRLADAVAAMLPEPVVVDFTEVRSMSSSFSNAFYLRLLELHGTDVVGENLRVEGASAFQTSVLEKSLESAKARLVG